MLIINGGLPRSGTVLVGNLARLMVERRGLRWDRYNPQERRHLPEFLQVVRTYPAEPALIVHTHLIDDAILRAASDRTDARVIWNIRDPRDCLVSLMRLHDLNLNRALHAMGIYLAHAALVWDSDSKVLKIRYEDLRKDTGSLITAIAIALGFALEPGEAVQLQAATSMDRHRSVMKGLSETSEQVVTHVTKTRQMREDEVTLINDRHIQSGASGRWKEELAAPEQKRVNEALRPWLDRFGYSMD
ncbi:MAG: sulfotransferase domain-containing protein [Pseudomonadota bacterium]